MGTGQNQWNTSWPDEQVQLLTNLWKKGIPIVEIAEAINNTTHGPKRTKSAIIGKAHRKKLGPHPTEYIQDREKKSRKKRVQRKLSITASKDNRLVRPKIIQRKRFGNVTSTAQPKPKKRQGEKISDMPAKIPSRPQPIYTSAAFAAPGLSLDERRFLANLYPKD